MGKILKVPPIIALDSAKQKSYSKTVKRIHKKTKKAAGIRVANKDAYLERGLIYISHLPHGFYEQQLKGYFTQFGKVTNVRVLRSHKTGRSKGAGFVEFQTPEVAKIAATTMDNYLMFKRRLVSKYIEPEDRHKTLFNVHITATKFPKKKRQNENRCLKNSSITPEEHVKRVVRKMKQLKRDGELEHCQIANVCVNIPGIEINQLTEKADAKKATKKGKVKTEAELVKASVTEESKQLKKSKSSSQQLGKFVRINNDSVVISEQIKASKKKMKPVGDAPKKQVLMPSKEVKKSLKTIKKAKDSLKPSATHVEFDPKSIRKVSVKSKAADGKNSKAKLTLDPNLVTEVRLVPQKGRKNLEIRARGAKRS